MIGSRTGKGWIVRQVGRCHHDIVNPGSSDEEIKV